MIAEVASADASTGCMSHWWNSRKLLVDNDCPNCRYFEPPSHGPSRTAMRSFMCRATNACGAVGNGKETRRSSKFKIMGNWIESQYVIPFTSLGITSVRLYD